MKNVFGMLGGFCIMIVGTIQLINMTQNIFIGLKEDIYIMIFGLILGGLSFVISFLIGFGERE